MKNKKIEYSKEELEIREKIEKEFYVKAVWGMVASALFLVIVFGIIFFVNLEGQEDTKVPNLTGLKLSEAIIELQDRALYPKLSLKNTSPKEKGLIISQDTSAGSVVKAGRVISITASLGGVIDTVGSYEGQSVQAVEAELQKLFSSTSSDPVLFIGTPVEVESKEPVGTILSQEPKAGTEITDITELIFHVSKGELTGIYQVPTMVGLTFEDGLKKITQWPIRYRFTVRKKRNNETAGMIISQTPTNGGTVPWSTILEMTMTAPENYPSDFSFGVMELVVDEYPVSMPMRVERVLQNGDTEVLFTSRTFGGALTIPYLEQIGTRLIVSVDNTEINSFVVR